MLAGIRTLATLSFVLAIPGAIPFAGGDSAIGFRIFSALQFLRFQEAMYWWFAVVALLLLIDLLLGILEFVMVKPVPQSA